VSRENSVTTVSGRPDNRHAQRVPASAVEVSVAGIPLGTLALGDEGRHWSEHAAGRNAGLAVSHVVPAI